MDQDMSFGYLPEEYSNYEESKIVILPVPYDGTSTWVRGAAEGPEAILEASPNLEFYDIETGAEVYRAGICTDTPIDLAETPGEMVEAVALRVDGYLEDGKFPVVIGGEHSVAIGAIRTVARRIPKVTILQLDAHADLRGEYLGSKYNHACVMARAKELSPIVQVGIRSMDVSEKPSLVAENVFYARDLVGRRDGFDDVLARLGDRVYITIDLDVFDPGIMPSTGTPEPGGLGWYEVLSLLQAVTAKRQVVGFDVCELCPTKDNHAPDFLAAKLIYTLLSYRFAAEVK